MVDGTTLDSLRCEVTPTATRSAFGASVIAAPNLIDWSKAFANFANLSDNACVFGTVVSFIIVWIMLLVWANWQDRRDEKSVSPFLT